MKLLKTLFKINYNKRVRTDKDEIFKILADSVPVLIWIASPDKSRYFFNKVWLSYTGRSFEQEKGFGWKQGLHPADSENFIKIYNQAFDNRKPYEIEYRLRDKNGNFKWILSRGIPLYSSSEEFMGFIGCCLDIDERKKSDSLLEESEATKAAILNTALDAIISINENGIVTQWNHSAERMFDYYQSEALGKSLMDLIIPEDKKKLHSQSIKNYIHTGTSQILDKRIVAEARKKNGLLFPVELTATHVKSSGKNYFTAYIRDITENENSRIKLTESELNFRNLAEAMPQIVWTADINGKIDYTNKNWEITTGTPWENAMESGWGKSVHPDDLKSMCEKWKYSVMTGDPFEFEFRLLCKNNIYRWHLSRCKASLNDKNQVTKWFGTCTDIHDTKQYQIDLKEAKETAEAANKAKDRFLAILSHELRNPLSPVLMAVNSLEVDSTSPNENNFSKFKEDLGVIKRNVELEARLIDDLLDLSKIINNKYTLHKEKTCLNEILNNMMNGIQSQCDDKKIALVLDFSAKNTCVHADPIRLKQVISNLVSNAIKFTPSYGNILIRTYNRGESHIIVEVSDSGIGISEYALKKVFNPFEQGDFIIGSRFGGLGLGLAISKSLIELHGGEIYAKSEGRSRGSLFGFELCCAVPDKEKHQSIKIAKPIMLNTKSLNILIVEDNEDTNKIMKRLLKSLNYHVDSAFTLKEAMEKVNAMHFNIVISDIGLPDGSGLDLAEYLKDSETKCVALSGFGMEEDIIKSKNAGFSDHLIKPINFDTMQKLIEKLRD